MARAQLQDVIQTIWLETRDTDIMPEDQKAMMSDRTNIQYELDIDLSGHPGTSPSSQDVYDIMALGLHDMMSYRSISCM